MSRSRSSQWLVIAVVVIGCRPGHLSTAPPTTAPALVATGAMTPFRGSDTTKDGTLGRFGVTVTIHGRPLLMMADHGSNGSTLTDAATERAGLSHWLSRAARIDTTFPGAASSAALDSAAEMITTHGDTTFRYWGVPDPQPLDSLRIGTSRQDSVFLALEMPAESLTPFDGILGREFLSTFDILFDLPGGAIRLYERSHAASNQPLPRWLPAGLDPRDCVEAETRHHMNADTALSDSDKREIASIPLKRMWEQSELQLPVTVDGRPINAMFDSGAEGTTINWAEANAIGITRDNPRVRPYMSGGMRVLSPTQSSTDSTRRPYSDSTFRVAGVAFRIGRERLPSDSVFISDADFFDFPNYATQPIVSVGLRHLRDDLVFLSYSTSHVCLRRVR